MEDVSQAGTSNASDESSMDLFEAIMEEMEEGYLHLLQMQAAMETEEAEANVDAIATIAAAASNNSERQWGGSEKGKAPNKNRDFALAYEQVVLNYFSGRNSRYNEVDFERRFRMPRTVFDTLWNKIEGKEPFVQKRMMATKELGIRPLVRFIACLRKMAYGDASDRQDECFQISETVVDGSFKKMCKLIKEEFGGKYLNQCPNHEQLTRALQINQARGFPGMFASWDCKHMVWKRCPMAIAGQHKGKGEKNTLVLEAICDGDLYIWYSFFGEPGSLNDLNILDKSSIVGSLMDGSFDLRLQDENLHYVINGTKRDYFYFLVDGIYPRWSIFVHTKQHPEPGSPEAYFASCQEAVRKDIERAFGVLVMRFDILNKPLLAWDVEDIKNIVDACIIVHNMIVETRKATYSSDDYLDVQAAMEPVQGNNVQIVSMFSDWDDHPQQHAGLDMGELLAVRMEAINEDMKNEAEHAALQYDLQEDLWRNREN